jgi:hypothetical protein
MSMAATFFPHILVAATLIPGFTPVTGDQSLGTVARQQKADAKNREAAKPTHVYTNDDLNTSGTITRSRSQSNGPRNCSEEQQRGYRERLAKARQELAAERRKMDDLRQQWSRHTFAYQSMTGELREQYRQRELEGRRTAVRL